MAHQLFWLATFLVLSFHYTVTALAQKVIQIDDLVTYQEFHGCGGSWTDSAAWIMHGIREKDDPHRQLSDEERDAIFADLFSRSGINLSVLRQTMGTSDFRRQDYTYEDEEGVFTISNDQHHIIPTIVRSKQENRFIKIMAVPWSAPAWMKEGDTLNGGSLIQDQRYIDAYGQYFSNFVTAYENEGLPIWAVSIQNEPLHTSNSYPSMAMTPHEHITMIKAVKSAFDENDQSDVKIVGFEHNWGLASYTLDVLDDADAADALSAVAFHCYEGDPSAQTMVKETIKDTNPDLEIFFTECTEFGPVTSFNQDFRWALRNLVIGATRNWASTILEWNLVMFDDSGPKLGGGCENCRGLIDVVLEGDGLTYVKNPAYYALGHLSKFAMQGALRIDSNDASSLAMKNLDGSAFCIILNDSGEDSETTVNWFGLSCKIEIMAWSAATIFRTSNSSTVQVWATMDGESVGLVPYPEILCTPNPTVATSSIPSMAPTAKAVKTSLEPAVAPSQVTSAPNLRRSVAPTQFPTSMPMSSPQAVESDETVELSTFANDMTSDNDSETPFRKFLNKFFWWLFQ